MNALRRILMVAILGVGFMGLGFGSLHAQNSSPSQAAPPTANGESKPSAKAIDPNIPAYHPSRPRGPLPDTLDPKQFADAETQNIYALAAKEKSVLYQLPCYCRCDKEVGHNSSLTPKHKIFTRWLPRKSRCSISCRATADATRKLGTRACWIAT